MPASQYPLPHVDQPWIDTATGKPTQPFYQFLSNSFPRGVDVLASVLRLTPQRFNQLPAKPVEGMVASVIDGSTNTWGARLSGSGGFHVLAYFDGFEWTVAGK
jgi:hypothetical protein